MSVNPSAPSIPPRPPWSRRRHLGTILISEGLITRAQLEAALRLQEAQELPQPLGQVLVDQGAITQKQLEVILQKYRKGYRLGDLLVETRAISEDQLRIALDHQKKTDLCLGEILIQLNFLAERRLKQALSLQLGVPFVELDDRVIDAGLSNLINENYARRHRVIPVARIENQITVCLEDPTDLEVPEELRASIGSKIGVVIATRDAFDRAFARVYGQGRKPKLQPPSHEDHEQPGSRDEETSQTPAPLPGVKTRLEAPEGDAPARGEPGAIRPEEGESAMVVAKAADPRSIVEVVRRITTDCEVVVGSVETLVHESQAQRARFEQLQHEHQELRESHEQLRRQLDAYVEVLAKLEAERDALLREREAGARALAELRERHEVLAQARELARSQMEAALRQLSP